MNQTINDRDDRNVRAWAYDPNLIKEYSEACNRLDNKITSKKEKLNSKKEKLKEKLDFKLMEIGKERQTKLYNSKVLVVGSDSLAQMVLSCLAGIGVGNIYFMDNKRINRDDKNDFLVTPNLINIGQKKVKRIGESLKQINPTINIIARHSSFVEAFAYGFNPELIIEATNNPLIKKEVIKYAVEKHSIPVISASTNSHKGVVSSYWPRKTKIKITKENPDLESLTHKEFEGQQQGNFTSGIISGIITDEFRRFKFKYSDDDNNLLNNQRLVYNIYSETRDKLENNLKQDRLNYFRDKKALVAGAGALGNFVALELALLGVGKIDIVDKDIADNTNLSRQILLRDRLGDKKAKIVSERIKELDSNIETNWIYGKVGEEITSIEKSEGISLITENTLTNENYDIIFGCFDNKYARIWLNEFAVRNKIPYIDGGTNSHGGQLAIYIPNKTKCIDCQLDLKSFPERNPCQIDPSTIIPNIIISSAMVAESLNIFNPNLNKIQAKIFQYSQENPKKIYLRSKKTPNNNHC